MNYTQATWFDNASELERKAFVVNGEPESLRVFYCNQGKYDFENPFYYAMLRKVRVDDKKYATAEEAYCAAQKYKMDLLKETNLPKIDEGKLGIWDFNKKMRDDSSKSFYSVNQIIHLATQLINPSDQLEDFFDEHPETVKSVFEGAVDEKAISYLDDLDNYNKWMNWLEDHKVFGWLVQLHMPEIIHCHKYISYSWNLCTVRWFYAETYELALTKGREWIKKETKAATQKLNKKI